MSRLLVFVTLAYVTGIAAGAYLPLKPSLYLVAAMPVWLGWNLWKKHRGPLTLVPCFILFLAAGSLAFNLSLDRVHGRLQEYHHRRCTLVGMVADEPLLRDGSVVFPLALQRLQAGGREEAVSSTVRVTLYQDGGKKVVPVYGQEISVRGLLVVPEGKRNPGGFDYRSYLETRGLSAAFYAEARHLSVLGYGQNLSVVRRLALETKEKMAAVLQGQLPPAAGGLMVAMLFGERQALTAAVEEGIRRSGVAHLMAVSGLHVGLLAAILFLLFKRLGLKGWPACLLLVSLLFAYTYLTGLKPATLRAFIMLALGAVSLYLGRRKDLPTAVAAAALFTLCYNPLLLFHPGLQLSYAATISILLFAEPLQRLLLQGFARLSPPSFSPSLQEYGAGLLAVTTAAQLGTLPLSAFYFKEISLIALPANLLLLPVMGLLLGLGLFVAALGLVLPLFASLLGLAAYPLLMYMLWLTETLGAWPFSLRQVFPPRPWEMAVYYLSLLFIAWIARKGGSLPSLWAVVREQLHRIRLFHLLAAILLILLPLSWWGRPVFSPLPLEVVFLDVGQGDAIFIRTPGGKHILLDSGGGPVYQDDLERAGRLVVLPYLQYRRVKKLDLVIVSHPHEDHYGGLLAVLAQVPVDLFVTNGQEVEGGSYQKLLALSAEKGIPRKILQEGDRLLLEPYLEMTVLNPPARLFMGTGSDLNNNSLVLQLRYREVSFLFTGDLEDAGARQMLARGLVPSSNILKVPHHGGDMAAFAAFLDRVEPSVAVITVGNNPFGHPHARILSLLEERGIQTFRHDRHGAVMVRTDGYGWKIKTMLSPEPAQAFLLRQPAFARGVCS